MTRCAFFSGLEPVLIGEGALFVNGVSMRSHEPRMVANGSRPVKHHGNQVVPKGFA